MRSVQTGWLTGFAGMLMFSGGLPATRLAMAGMDPLFVTSARGAIAGLLAAGVLVARPQRRPTRADLPALAVVALGCVVGYPLLTALALRGMSAADAIVFAGLLPLTTAVAACLVGDKRPRWPFWVFAGGGTALVALFAASRGARLESAGAALMLLAVVGCGLGYAVGARAARRLGGWQVISWSLVLTLPISLPLTLVQSPSFAQLPPMGAVAGLAYVSVFTMLLGFMCWYDGLARAGTAAVGQLQLLQPFFGLLGAALVLHETVGWGLVAMLGALMACAACSRRFACPPFKLPSTASDRAHPCSSPPSRSSASIGRRCSWSPRQRSSALSSSRTRPRSRSGPEPRCGALEPLRGTRRSTRDRGGGRRGA